MLASSLLVSTCHQLTMWKSSSSVRFASQRAILCTTQTSSTPTDDAHRPQPSPKTHAAAEFAASVAFETPETRPETRAPRLPKPLPRQCDGPRALWPLGPAEESSQDVDDHHRGAELETKPPPSSRASGHGRWTSPVEPRTSDRAGLKELTSAQLSALQVPCWCRMVERGFRLMMVVGGLRVRRCFASVFGIKALK